MGGGSLSVSLVLHAILIIIALFWVLSNFGNTSPEEPVDFLPGGGGGGKGATEKKATRQRQAISMAAPKVRIASSVASSVTLPDLQTSLSSLSALSQVTPMGGGMGGGEGGIKGKGKGGLYGDGYGTGVGPGRGAGFVSVPMLFGQKIEARRLAVVLDMSGSMYPFLPLVIKEVDKVASGSTIILHYGCGLTDEDKPRLRVEDTKRKEFDEDKIVTSLLQSQTAAMNQTEREKLLEMVKKRPQTFYVPSSGVGTTWAALTDKRMNDVDAIYWFCDFADALDDKRLEDVARKLRGRKQKLYIQPSNPNWLKPGNPQQVNVSRVQEIIVDPSGGKVISVDLKKEQEKAEEADPKMN